MDVEAFKRAWQEVVERHAILRTGFEWEGVRKAVQVVYKGLKLPVREEDWRGMREEEQEERLEEELKEDRERGFDVRKAPLMRQMLIRLADDVYQFVWSQHHLVQDGWSKPILLREVFAFYEAYSRGEQLQRERPRPFKDYIAWLEQQDMRKAEEYWRRTLKGFIAPTPLERNQQHGVSTESDATFQHELVLSAEATTALQSFAQQHKLTMNTLVQGAWAILLSYEAEVDDVVFGSVVSGRPTDLPGVDSIMGLFINTIPVRVFLSPKTSLLDWLTTLQSEQAEARQFEYSPLSRVQAWSDLPLGTPLFESVVVFENYPVDPSVQERSGGLGISNLHLTRREGHHPIVVTAVPRSEFVLRLSFDYNRFQLSSITRMMDQLQMLLNSFVEQPEAILKDLSDLLYEEDRRREEIKEKELQQKSVQKLKSVKRKPVQA